MCTQDNLWTVLAFETEEDYNNEKACETELSLYMTRAQAFEEINDVIDNYYAIVIDNLREEEQFTIKRSNLYPREEEEEVDSAEEDYENLIWVNP